VFRNWGKASRSKRSRLSIFVLGVLLIPALELSALSLAETGSDLVISKDGGNVNVNLNTASSSDVSIRRNDDVMVIKVPKSYQGGLKIDSSLKKNSVVEENETPTGKTITIQSQQIYLHTWEGHPGSVAGNATIPVTGNKPENKPESGGSKSASSPEASEKGAPEPGGLLMLSTPQQPQSLNPEKTVSAPSNQPKPRVSHAGKTPRRSVLELTRLLEQTSLLSEPKQAKPNHVSGHKNIPTPKSLAENSETQEGDESTVDQSDPESEALEADGKAQAGAIQASINGLLRIFFSLIAVLGLAVAFMKILLPKLMDRFPDFFEKLRQQRQWANPLPNSLKPSTPKSSEPHRNILQDLILARKPNQSPVSETSMTEAKPSDKKGYLQRLRVAGEAFEVLQSTSLGKGKELHVVTLKGKEFLVATTPYTVTLLKDLSEETAAAPAAQQIAETWDTPAIAEVRQAKAETIAYLSDEAPSQRAATSKVYGTKPGKPGPGRTGIPQFPAPLTGVYQNYLPPRPQIASPPRNPHPMTQSTSQPAYVDAEEVVVLEDYDDILR
jgi:hypothetical protein